MPASRSRGKKPQDADLDQSPTPGQGANSSPTVGSVEASPSSRLQSTSAPSPSSAPPPPRRSLRLAASSNAQSPLSTMHVSLASVSPSDVAFLDLGIQPNSAPPHQRAHAQNLNPDTSTGVAVGKRGSNFSVVDKSVSGGSGIKRKRGRPRKGVRIGENSGDESVARRSPPQPKRRDISREVVEIEEENEEQNVANSDNPETVNFADSQSGSVEIAGEEEHVNFRYTQWGIDKRNDKLIIDEELHVGAKGAASKKETLSYKDKGKGKLIELDKVSDSDDPEELRKLVKDAVAILSLSLASRSQVQMEPQPEEMAEMPDRPPTPLREAQRNKAKELASGFARFTKEKGEESMKDDEELTSDGPGRFSLAMKIIKENAVRLSGACNANSFKGNSSAGVKISWTPSNEGKRGLFGMKIPLLKELAVKALAANADEIESLVGIPYAMRNQLSFVLCCTRKMNMNHLAKLMEGNLMELRLSDCSWASEKDFEYAFGNCDKSNLEVQLMLKCSYISCEIRLTHVS
jgi:hypothetical protein